MVSTPPVQGCSRVCSLTNPNETYRTLQRKTPGKMCLVCKVPYIHDNLKWYGIKPYLLSMPWTLSEQLELLTAFQS